ncbi:MAG: FtsX-like permease family protein [Candidatus Bathyarchaeia archaeon]
MSETAFPVNDLLRRRLQTGLTLTSVTACVAATLFLLLLGDQVGSGISATARRTLTIGYAQVFSQFLLFVGILVFAVGAVVVSFVVFLMMAQRTRDFGLMKATGCPNSLVFGYFFTELLLVTVAGCILGVAVGFGVDYAVINTGAFQVYQKTPNFWFAPVVFVAFFIFAVVFGAKPMFEAARMSPVKALSPMQYFGLGKGKKLKTLSKSGLTLHIASRSLFRRQNATVRIVIFLSLVFILLTVSIAGSIIARDTTDSWVERAAGQNVVLVANAEMSAQYTALLLKFSGTQANDDFNYLNPTLALPDGLLQQLRSLPTAASVDARLVTEQHVQELSNFTIDPQTMATLPVGDHREADLTVIGVNPDDAVSSWYMRGRFFVSGDEAEAVLGDSAALLLFDEPLSQSFRMLNATFANVGICTEPLNNGIVIYVPLNRLINRTQALGANVALVKLNPSASYADAIAELREQLKSFSPDLTVTDLSAVTERNQNFLGDLWSKVLFLPLFCLTAAAISLVSYLMLSIEEQHQEFAVLRATGMKPKTVVSVLGMQSLIVLGSSFAVGISLGTMITLLILMKNPLVTGFTLLQIAGLLLLALTAMFLVSLYPAVKFSKKPLLKIMS